MSNEINTSVTVNKSQLGRADRIYFDNAATTALRSRGAGNHDALPYRKIWQSIFYLFLWPGKPDGY